MRTFLPRPRIALFAMALAGILGLSACESMPFVADRGVEFGIEPSHDTIMSGETVTLTAHTVNLVGRGAEIEWEVGGDADVEVLQGGRVVQVTFNEPGMHYVDADLMVDGELIRSARATIQVNPIATDVTDGDVE